MKVFKLFLGFILGSIFVLAFSPFDFWFLSLLIPFLLYLLIKNENFKNIFFISYFFGFGLWLWGIFWIENSISNYGGTTLLISSLLTVGLAAFLSLFQAISFSVFYPLKSNQNINLFLVFPSVWIISEWAREFILSGFPWLFIGYTATENIFFRSYVPLLGSLGVGFIIVLFSCAIGSFVFSLYGKRSKQDLYPIAVITLILSINFLLIDVDWTTEGKEIDVEIIQPNLSIRDKWGIGGQIKTQNYFKKNITENIGTKLNREKIIFWPEVSFTRVFSEKKFSEIKDILKDEERLGVVIGTLTGNEKGEIKNSLVGLGLIEGFYDKKRLVPMGEFIPMENILGRLFDLFQSSRPKIISGSGKEILKSKNISISAAICYDIAYQNTFLEKEGDTNLLLNASNDNWFGQSIGPYQHLQIARFRAAEHQKYLVRVTSTGISALIGPDGKIIQDISISNIDIDQRKFRSIKNKVSLRSGKTPMARYGKNWFIASILITMFLITILKIRSKWH